ncbi:hypothetical protein B0H67DRAFT_644487 [Lasiosphaeris hirsuta]|uniref:Zn(2)-C6 fungal-type domain-containing protein n=1 Tax=Lasiosphaeris hirsuta TaxID=260670 RepID=A0AA40AF02_9PEZI|nr:hypothetical protein B0H67DRAFT_644487 [Lasiosphaeris hirsuta]
MDSNEVGSDGSQHDDDMPSPSSPPAAPSSQATKPPPKKTAVRKRTKTGCLTCRRRRIKCDEGKPTCNNCIKSKRQCEGYNQRLTFKEPLGSFPSGSIYGPSYYQQQVQNAHLSAQLSASQVRAASSQGPLAMIAPKPPSVDFTGGMPLQFGHAYQGQPNTPLVGVQTLSPTLYSPQHPLPTPPPVAPDTGLPSASVPQIGHDGFFNMPPTAQEFEATRRPSQVSPIVARYRQSIILDDDPQSSPLNEDLGRTHFRGGYWQSDDEASMGESEDERLPDSHLKHLESNELGIQVAQRLQGAIDIYGTQMRTFASPLINGVLDTYTPSSASSPLNDAQTAAVFWYFVNVTGPSMSLYERHPFDPAPMFQGRPVPKARRHIWTYIFPIIAFSHPALMQAILALGSLQMAKLQGIPPTAAMKHYHLSLRRVAKNYSSLTKRTQPATLAATLLLGFYEVWNSDHEKWCKHMWGARAILKEIPLREMTREILALKRKKQRQHICDASCPPVHCPETGDLDELDPELICLITGQMVSYTDYGHILDGEPIRQSQKYTERDIETYETISDLYWWFCKMDIYQSVLGGTRPFMEYVHWTQCAPRAPFGRIDAVYGTFDHLMLLLGRLVSFASRDLARKRKAMRAGRGPVGYGGPGGPGGLGPRQGPGQGPPGPPMGPLGMAQSPPMFPGLLPSTGHFVLPRGFTPPRGTSPSNDSVEDIDLDESTADAVREWDEIRQAFEVFRNHLGPDFAPLGPDHAVPEMTPFGLALMYRTFSISGIWMNYYMGLIVLYRSQPSMPPVAMAAAGMAAQQTAPWANEIARIAAGVCEDLNNVNAVSPLIGAACIESSFCLFVSGIQFRSVDQRHWVVRRLHSIARLTGWQSARQIADGCESAWIKAAQLGRGPPYHSPEDLGPLYPDSVWNRPRRIDRRIQSLEGGDNRLALARTEQAHYALGLLSVEQDLDRLDLIGTD